MLLNFIKISLRHFSKDRLHSAINVSGLTIGMACFILLFLFVKNELSYDASNESKDLIYQVYVTDSTGNNKGVDKLMPPLGPLLEEAIPEIMSYVRFGGRGGLQTIANGNRFTSFIHCADARSIELFDINLIGVSSQVFQLKEGEIVISKSEAEKLYGSVEGAVGKTFEIVDYNSFIISAVFEDISDNSHLDLNYLISFDYVSDLTLFKVMDYVIDLKAWAVSAFPTYIQVEKPLDDIEFLEAKIESIIAPHIGQKVVKLVALDQIYFSDWNNSYFKAKGEKVYVNLYAAIALIILIVAIVNYVNLSTARFTKRTKEVGIRKVIGGHRRQLIQQFLTESVTLTIISLVLAICVAELAMPYFNIYTGKSVYIEYSSTSTYLVFISFAVILGLIAGIYPSLFLSKLSPLRTFNLAKNKGIFRKVLVGLQFAICLSLMAVTGIVYNQYQHMRTLDVGFNKERVIMVPLVESLQKSYMSFKNELLRSPKILGVEGSSFNLFDGGHQIETDAEGRKDDIPIIWERVEKGFFDLMGIQIDQGILFSEQESSESAMSLIVNQSAVKALGWESGLGKWLISMGNGKITGVVNDFIYGSAREQVFPLMISEAKGDEGSLKYAYIRIEENMPSVVNTIEEIFNNYSNYSAFEYTFLDDHFAAKYEIEEKLSQVFTVFSLLAVFIAGLGIFGLSVFIAESRVKEIGIRKVLGAGVSQIVWLLNNGTTLLILGVSILTLPLVYFFTNRWLQEFANSIELNVSYFVAPLLLLMSVAWIIQFYQSIKTARTNPIKSLRNE